MRIASIDVGTNTLRLLVLDAHKGKEPRKLYVGREITRLGEGFTDDGKLINQNAMDRSLRALTNFSLIIKEYRVRKLRAVATSAVRESSNGPEFVRRAEEETGIPVEVISGEEEARLTVKGVLRSVSFDTPDCLIFDIGGGSTEYVYVRRGEIAEIASTDIGVVPLTEQYLKSDTTSAAELARLNTHIDGVLGPALARFPKPEVGAAITLVGTAGTPTTLAAIAMRLSRYDPGLVNNFTLTKEMIDEILKTLIGMPKQERTKIPGLEKGREDLIVSGILITLKTLERFPSDKMLVSDAGLLEGVAYNLII